MQWIVLSRQAREEGSAKLLYNVLFAGDYTLRFYALGGLYLAALKKRGLECFVLIGSGSMKNCRKKP
jgi:hypothetical protein